MPEYYKIKGETLTNIADAIREKIGNGGGQITPLGMPDKIASIDGGGTEITDGIVVKARNSSGRITEVDYYGSSINNYQFGFNGYGTRCNPFSLVSKVNFKSAIPKCGVACLFGSAINIKSLDIPENVVFSMKDGFASDCAELETVNILSQSEIDGYSAFARNPKLKTFYAPKMTYVSSKSSKQYAMFLTCPLLESVQFGSIGYGVTWLTNSVFNNEQSNLIITVYTSASHVDTFVSNIRNGATAATIIIKASETTTYNGTTYNAGDTILTSEVTS